jgi:hypothetical protein
MPAPGLGDMAATWFERNFYVLNGERPRLLIASNHAELNDMIKSLPLEHCRLGWCTLMAAAEAYLPRREPHAGNPVSKHLSDGIEFPSPSLLQLPLAIFKLYLLFF